MASQSSRNSSRSSQKQRQRSSQTSKQWTTYKVNKAFKRQMDQAEKNQPIYRDAYKGLKDATVANLERSRFEYDTANDPTYQAYSRDYRLLGEVGAGASVEGIEGLSGGYGTTYSGAVAQQGLDNHLSTEKAIIPALYQNARQGYQADVAAMINKGNLYNALEGQDYAQFQDRLAAWNANREYAYNKFMNAYNASAKTHQTTKGKESSTQSASEHTNSSSVTVTPTTGRTGRKGKGVSASNIKNESAARRYLISKGYGDKMDDLLTRQEYITQRARQDRDYNAGYTGLEKGDEDYDTKKAAEDKVDLDYSGYLYKYIQKKLKGKK